MKAYRNDILMFISDTHYPYSASRHLDFLATVRDFYKPERVFHLGDLADQYLFSSYAKVPEADSLPDELKKTRRLVRELGNEFPDMLIMSSNHDDRVYKRSRLAGVPKELLLPYNKLIGADKFNWKWVEDYQLRLPNKSHLYMAHTKSGTSFTMAKNMGMNVITGHHHSSMGVNYFKTPMGLKWGASCPCLIGDDRYAFAYNKGSIVRPILGCVMVVDNHPIMIPME